jgi:hypothetical protein
MATKLQMILNSVRIDTLSAERMFGKLNQKITTVFDGGNLDEWV